MSTKITDEEIMEMLTKLLRDSYLLQEGNPEESAYWHLQMLRSAIKKLESTESVDVVLADVSDCEHPRKNRDYIGNNTLRCNLCGYTFK